MAKLMSTIGSFYIYKNGIFLKKIEKINDKLFTKQLNKKIHYT